MALTLVDHPARTWPAVPRETERRRQLDGARLLLERARALVAAGWVQDAFHVVRDRHGRTRPVSPFGLLFTLRAEVVGGCLVGAVSHATAAADKAGRRGHAALAVDLLWETLTDTGVDPHPVARPGRVRDLARWNDEPGRTREDVLGLLDRAVSRSILTAVG